jgi:hypothetical protein
MNAVAAPHYPLFTWAGEAIRRWGWRETGLGAAVGLLTLVAMGFPLNPSPGERKLFEPLAYNILQFGLPMVLFVQIADRAVDAGARPWLAYGTTVLLVSVVGVWPIARLLWPILGKEDYWGTGNDFWLAFNTQLWHALGIAVYASWRRERQVRTRAIAAEREQAERARELASARLLALQAQVEPKVLFDALSELQRLLTPDTAGRADRLLEDLIALLRLLLTRADARASTVQREQALVQAFGRVLGEAALMPPRLQWRIDDDSITAHVAPLWLPSLLRGMVQAAAPQAAWIVSVKRDGDRVRLLLLAEAGELAALRSAAAAIDLAAVRARLRDVHGPEVLVQRAGDEALAMDETILWRIEWPYRRDDDTRADR